MAEKAMLWECSNGDCLTLMADIPDGSVDMILCDLPYGTTACKWDAVIPFEPLWAHYKRVIKPNGAIVLFGSQPFTSALVMSNPSQFKYELVWDKVNTPTGHLNAKKQPMRRTERISVFYSQQPTYNPQFSTGKPVSKTGDKRRENSVYREDFSVPCKNVISRYPIDLVEFSRVQTRHGRLHPTQKPVDLCEYLIRTFTNDGDIVLDNCMGSGTTGVACMNTGRRFIGIEQDSKYFEIACERLNKVGDGELSVSQLRCEYCDGTGDVTGLDGEYRGPCNCGEPSQFREEMARIDAELKVGAGDTANANVTGLAPAQEVTK